MASFFADKILEMLIPSWNPTRSLANLNRTASLLCVIALAGCAQNAVREFPAEALAHLDSEARTCASLLARVDTAVARARASDAMTTRVAGFPYLRVNRLLASYRDAPMDQPRYLEWTTRMAALARDGYSVEIENLSQQARAQLSGAPLLLEQTIASCIDRLRESDTTTASRDATLRRAAQVPDDYADWKRVVGVYYLTRMPVAAGVNRSNQHMQGLFEQRVEDRARERIRYQPATPLLDRDQVAALMSRVQRGSLGIPDPDEEALQALFAAHAPVFEIDTASSDDQIGALTWGGALPTVDTTMPVVYTHVSHVRVGARALLQLNYVVWLPARPKSSAIDALAGHLDGLTWRVTLDEQGDPLVYDSMHNCGCYHLFIVTRHVKVREVKTGWDERALVPQSLEHASATDRITLRAEANSHYLYRALVNDSSDAPTRTYELRPYRELRVLARADGTRRSVFDEQGLIKGSERLERYFLWPMGIAEPGAMRILGRHATAFVGRRHFDDADVLEKLFAIDPP